MKKILYTLFFCLILSLFSCNNNDDFYIINNDSNYPQTEVFVQGEIINYIDNLTRAGKYGDKWPHAENGWESAKFSIRIDRNIPGYVNQSAIEYIGGQEGPNLGKIYSTYPYGRYDDRGFDYYKVDKATGNNIGLFRYVFDPTGININKVFVEIPDMKEVLEYWKAKNRSQKEVNDINSLLDNWDDLHIIWYVVKEVGSHNLWHVNGVITLKTIDNIFDTTEGNAIQNDVNKYKFETTIIDPLTVKDNIEVDIHLQEHKDWNEIKTSIHIRQSVDTININLPIEYENIVEKDDFDIRIYEYYYKEYTISHKIEHNDKGITIQIYDIPETLINFLKSQYGDGLNIEIHSYTKQLENIWESLKNSEVRVVGDCTLIGQITSAYTNKKIIISN